MMGEGLPSDVTATPLARIEVGNPVYVTYMSHRVFVFRMHQNCNKKITVYFIQRNIFQCNSLSKCRLPNSSVQRHSLS